MSTVKKGNQFEKKSIEIIENLRNSGLFGLKEYLNITPKAKYYSSLRKSYIEFDLVIEFKPPNANKAMLTYFIECKNYDKRVPVGQVQKFHSDILQVAGVNAKGIIISNGPFQKSAYDFAESTGMMIIEGESVENFNIIFHKRSSEHEGKIPLIKELLNIDLFDSGLSSTEKLIDQEIFNILTKSKNDISYNIDKLSKENIEDLAAQELDKFDKAILKNAYSISVKELTEFLSLKYGITVIHFNPDDNKHLGTCNIDKKEIGISKKIVDTQRELFVLGHEFGHFILHQKLSINQELLNSFSDSKYDFSINKNRLENPRHWIEWQANQFSASLTLPQYSIIARLWIYQNIQNLTKGKLYLDDQIRNQKSFRIIISKLSNYFNVSKTSIIYRLGDLNMITDKSRIKSVGQLINGYRSKYFT